MFARFVTLLPLAAIAAVAAAAPNKFANPSSFKEGPLGLIDVLLGLGVNAGVHNGAQCTQQTACCENVQQNGLVNVACSPVAVPV
ncbi:hypothetical protein EV363DRAFT_1310100 [Boletus edulis]|nr:hypothetical protein EV363DRAFT_1310100 [Boletus edulis]